MKTLEAFTFLGEFRREIGIIVVEPAADQVVVVLGACGCIGGLVIEL
ncbi:hypothetical protein NJB1507_08500 [Mycobacterium marinum]|nr:hypothetical protein [Mycobacterium marinum]GJO17895.1 hypothetical protein NJB1507_08500 [Mycobacterium marinum]